ncbi:MAG: aminodeoxychorismate synthase component I [Candidatus Longimicrobiales bacterium M2_2A_002]
MTRLRFDFPGTGRTDRGTDRTGRAVFTDPVRVIRADTLPEVVPALEAIADAAAAGLHAAGCVAYEAAPALDPAMAVRRAGPLPLLWFGVYEAEDRVPGEAGHLDRGAYPGPGTGPWELELSRDEHAAAIAAIRDAIAEGRTYQVNLTTRMRAPFTGSPDALYHSLRRAQGGGFHALLDLGRHVIVSASPELFFETRGRAITARPMKGTRPRGRWPEEDRALRAELEASPKDRAENLMIVDLLRNDLGRVCVPGGVSVPSLFEVERYRTVWQMTSTVTGTLRTDIGLVDLFRALFPCGSVTGAPKISTMGMIAELEPSARGVYCGAIGRVRPGGDCTFSVPIRTAVIDRAAGEISYGTGGGIVWDSTPAGEWDELLAKTAVVRNPWPAFRLLETLAAEAGEPVRLERHLRRMAASGERFDFRFDEDDVRAAIRDAVRGLSDRRMLRVTAGPAGDVDVEVKPLDRAGMPGVDPDGPELPVVVLAERPIDPTDPFLYHKTTHRAVYRRHRAQAPDRAFDVLLRNPDGRVTEFCRGNLVAELDGRLRTPALDAGLLPGCFRAELLDQGTITEDDLTLEDVLRADRLWFINSARRWLRVRLVER